MLISLTLSCQSCFVEYEDALLSKSYDFVAGILLPDSGVQHIRSHPIEIFVGRIIPAKDGNVFYIKGVSDYSLHNILYATRQHYRIYYEYDSTATVILHKDGDSTILQYSGYGIYRTGNSVFPIMPKNTYTLEVRKNDGKIFTSTTRVPAETIITEPAEDTVKVTPDPNLFTSLIRFKIKCDPAPAYFGTRSMWSNYPVWLYAFGIHDTDFSEGVVFLPPNVDTSKIDFVDITFNVRAYDSAYAVFNQPANFTSAAGFSENWYDKYEEVDIRKRSNINGQGVVGFFGSCTGADKNFTAQALWGVAKKK